MTKVRNIGRPVKKNAVKSGQLAPGLVRFSFITDRELIKKMKQAAKSSGLSIKDYMTELLKGVQEDKPVIKTVAEKKQLINEAKLLAYMNQSK